MNWTSTNPATGEIVWQGMDGDVASAVAQARAAAVSWARTPLATRIDQVTAYRDMVRTRADAFAEIISRETGKPVWEARTEVASVAAKVDIAITAQSERAGERISDASGVSQVIRHKPHGVLAVLGPYNFPAHLPNGHIVPAILAGNVVVFKPSEQTPAAGAFMAQCWHDAGLPAGVLMLVQGRADTGRALGAHADIDGLLFTGSSLTGAKLHAQFATQLQKILAIETGGNNPLIAWDIASTDTDAAASLVVQSAFLSAGQRCSCTRRLIVQEDHAALMDRIIGLTDQLIIGAPFDDPSPFMGPVISNAAADQVVRAWEGLVGQGASIIRPLVRLHPDQPFLSPGILDVTGVNAPDEEIFGPVLQVIRVDSFEEALAAANKTRFGLAAGLIGGDRPLYDRFWAESRAGVVNWNRPTTGASSAAPFGGVGLSGNHRPSAYYAADYCAWPVASLESAALDGGTITGLRQPAS
jgi:succinylglutamic semialdehyde dehydrogenase